MPEEVYERLRELLDRHPTGCQPAPEIIEILKIFFTEEEARVALGLGFRPFGVKDVARRAGVVRRLYQLWCLHVLVVLAGIALLCLKEYRSGWVPAGMCVGVWLCWSASLALVTHLYRVGLRGVARRTAATTSDAP